MQSSLHPEPLTREAFAAFGDVIEMEGAAHYPINQGFAERFNDLARVDMMDGAVNVSLFLADPRPRPIVIDLMERHPLGSQAFMPLQDAPWLIVVALDPRDAASFRAFSASGRQGVNYARNAWHFPLLVTGEQNRFLVIDRKGEESNLEEISLRGRELYLK
jgi:ureidoglycolate lyase